MNKKGEVRKGGMPVGWKKPEGVRTMRSMKAYDDEWQLIKDFAAIVKKGDKQAAKDFVDNYKAQG